MTVEAPSRPLYHSPRGLYDFQAEGVAQCYLRTNNLAVWDTGIGKALRNDQRVVTPRGWRKIGDLAVGDEVMGSDGLPHRVMGVYPQGIRPLWKVTFGDGAEVVCDEDHLWQVEYWGSSRDLGRQERVRRTRVLTTREIVDNRRVRPYSIPLTDPVQYPEADLPIDPYTLGAFIGDGGLTQGTPRLTSGDQEIVGNLILPPEVEIRESYRRGCWTWRFVTPKGAENPLLNSLRDLGVCVKSGAKRIPEPYLYGSVAQRIGLLRGLMDTDGYCGSSIEFATSSEGLAEDVAELVRSLGGTASLHRKSTTHLDSFTVRIVLKSCPFRLSRKVDRWKPRRNPYRPIVSIERVEDDEATCITVDSPDSLFLTEGYAVTHNTHLAMATAALLFEDDKIDICLIICEQNKVTEWVEDFGTFTELTTTLYYGAPKKREKIRGEVDEAQVLVSTYETARNDAWRKVEVEGRKTKKPVAGPLSEALEGKRVLLVYDEMTKLGNRSSQNHKAHDFMVQHLRRTWDKHELFGGKGVGDDPQARVLGLTATPIERSPENLYNLGRIFMPGYMTVAQFDRDYVATKDIFGNATRFKNLSPDNMTDPRAKPFNSYFNPIVLRKRKTDADVVDQFPQTVSEVTYVDLDKSHLDFYLTVRDLFDDGSEQTERLLFNLLRQIAGHPMALLHSEGKMAKAIVDEVGEEGLAKLGSAKLDRLVEYLTNIVHGQGAQAVVFTFFGPSMTPYIKKALEDVEISVALNHGQMSNSDRETDKAAFKAGERDVFLTSDAGARGINLPEALYVVEYEMALTHALQTQRLNRIHRIDSKHPSVTFQSFIARDTIEEGIANLVLRRHGWSDEILDSDDPEGHVTAEMRRKLIRRAKADVQH